MPINNLKVQEQEKQNAEAEAAIGRSESPPKTRFSVYSCAKITSEP